jgi:hypothetical protein
MSGHALNGTAADYTRCCEMLLHGGAVDGDGGYSWGANGTQLVRGHQLRVARARAPSTASELVTTASSAAWMTRSAS